MRPTCTASRSSAWTSTNCARPGSTSRTPRSAGTARTAALAARAGRVDRADRRRGSPRLALPSRPRRAAVARRRPADRRRSGGGSGAARGDGAPRPPAHRSRRPRRRTAVPPRRGRDAAGDRQRDHLVRRGARAAVHARARHFDRRDRGSGDLVVRGIGRGTDARGGRVGGRVRANACAKRRSCSRRRARRST